MPCVKDESQRDGPRTCEDRVSYFVDEEVGRQGTGGELQSSGNKEENLHLDNASECGKTRDCGCRRSGGA